MRLAFIGASHWHLPLYLEPALDLPGVEVVGISDPDEAIVAGLKERLGCAGSIDFRNLCDEVRPDFVIALGRHCDMADGASYLIDARIPFAIEKPCGLNSAEVAILAERAAEAGVFAAVPLVIRDGPFIDTVRARLGDDEIAYMSFRLIAGPVSRYRAAGCAWMLDPAQSGGGCTINLGVHFFDLARLLVGADVRVVQATMSSALSGEAIEDYSIVTLRQGARTCVIETGYFFPAPTSVFDLHYAIATRSHYIIASGANTLELRDREGKHETLAISTTNVPHYRDFIAAALRRCRAGLPPRASLADMAAIMRLVDEAYAVAGRER